MALTEECSHSYPIVGNRSCPSRSAQVFHSRCIFFHAAMGVRYDRELMTRGEAARRLIADGEDPWVMLLAAVSPDHDWSESLLHAELASCPRCSNDSSDCPECGNTGLVTAARRKLSVFERVAALAHAATA